MRLLLTSNGITNESIREALLQLVPEPRFAFIPTAALLDPEPKGWMIEHLAQCADLGPTDVVEIAAVPRSVWLSRLQAANVIVLGGGETADLMDQLGRTGLADELRGLLAGRVLMGISAGSIVCGPSLHEETLRLFGDHRPAEGRVRGLGLVPCHIVPHFESPQFPSNREEQVLAAARAIGGATCALDDDSALVVCDGRTEVITTATGRVVVAQPGPAASS